MPPKYKQINPYPLTLGGPPQQRFQNTFTPYSPTYINQSTSPQSYQIISPRQQQPIYSIQSPRQQQMIYPFPQQMNPQIQNQVVGSQQPQKDLRDRLISNKTNNTNNNQDSQRRTMTFNVSTQKKQQNEPQTDEISNLRGQITPTDFDGNPKDFNKLLQQKLLSNNVERQSPNCDVDHMQTKNQNIQQNKDNQADINFQKQEQLISYLNKQIQELQQQNESLQNQINDAGNANNQEYLQILRDQVNGERGQNALLSDQIKELQQQMTKERVEMKILESKIQLMNQNKLTQSKVQNNDNKLKEQVEQLQNQIKELKQQKEQDEQEKSRKNQYIQILREQLEGERAHNELNLTSENNVSNEEHENFKLKNQQEKDQFVKMIQNLESEKVNQSDQFKNLTKQLQNEIINRENKEQQNQSIQEINEKLTHENDNLKQYIAILREQLDAERAHNNFNQNANNEANGQIGMYKIIYNLKKNIMTNQNQYNKKNRIYKIMLIYQEINLLVKELIMN